MKTELAKFVFCNSTQVIAESSKYWWLWYRVAQLVAAWKNEIAIIKMPKKAFFKFPIGWQKEIVEQIMSKISLGVDVSRKPLSWIAIFWISPKATYCVLPSWSYLPKIDDTSKGCLIFGPGRPEHWRPQVITNLIAQLLKIHSSHNNLKHFDFFPLDWMGLSLNYLIADRGRWSLMN